MTLPASGIAGWSTWRNSDVYVASRIPETLRRSKCLVTAAGRMGTHLSHVAHVTQCRQDSAWPSHPCRIIGGSRDLREHTGPLRHRPILMQAICFVAVWTSSTHSTRTPHVCWEEESNRDRPKIVAAFYSELFGVLRGDGTMFAINPKPQGFPPPNYSMDRDEPHSSYSRNIPIVWRLCFDKLRSLRNRAQFIGKSSPVHSSGQLRVYATLARGRSASPRKE